MKTLALALSLIGCAAQSGPDDPPPNFVIILADDMGYGDSSVYDGWIETPQLERMAREGLTFTDFHSSGTVCSPTRAGLLTGLYQQRVGVPGVINADPKHATHASGLTVEHTTFAELLRDAGYRTAVFGKWHLGYTTEFGPLRHGFEEFRGFVSGNIDYQSHYDRMGTFDWWVGEEKRDEPGYLTHLLTRHAVDYIGRHKDEPFCLYLPHGAVHSPIQGPTSPAIRGPNRQKKDGRARDVVVREMMAALDEHVGAVLDALEAQGVADRTLVIFLSDNGGAGHMRNDPLRGRKGTVWEGGHRVPAIAWWPGRIGGGGESDQLCISLDLMPTMLGLAGVDAPKSDGISLEPALAGQSLGERQLFWKGVAMRDGPWKLIRRGGKSQLYDLSNDIGERRDVAAAHPERVDAMSARLDAWRRDVGI